MSTPWDGNIPPDDPDVDIFFPKPGKYQQDDED